MGSRKRLGCSEISGRLPVRAALAALVLTFLVTAAWPQSPSSASGRYMVKTAVALPGVDSRMVADITILDKASGETRQVTVPLESRGDGLEASVVADRTLIVLEQRRYGHAVTVADVLTGTIVDRVLGLKMSLTVDKTRAAYLYYGGRAILDDVVVVYDFTRSPRENASKGFSSEALAIFAPKGIILFPLENRARLAYQSRSDPVRVVLSPIAWCNDNRIAFLASTFSVRWESGCQVTVPGSETHLVEMSVPANPWQAKIIADRVVDPLLVYGLEGQQWPLPGPPPQVRAKELRYSEDCRSITIVPYGDTRIVPGAAPIRERPVTLPVP